MGTPVCRLETLASGALNDMIAIRIQIKRKRQEGSVRHAEKRHCRAGTLWVHGPIRPTSSAFATKDTAQGEKHLFDWENQAILKSDGRPLGECQTQASRNYKGPSTVFMKELQSNLLIKICAYCSNKLGKHLDIKSISEIENEIFSSVNADGPQAYFVDDENCQDQYVLIVSNPEFPTFTSDAAEAAIAAKTALGATLGQHVCTPIISDKLNGRSFSLFIRYRNFTTRRYLKYLQFLLSARAIIKWQAKIFKKTGTRIESTEKRIHHAERNLKALEKDNELSPLVRGTARQCKEKMENGELNVYACLHHGDFWFGNVLFDQGNILRPRKIANNFVVIDWAGCRVDGYPAIDVLRLSISMFERIGIAHWVIEYYRSQTGLTKDEFVFHSMCAIGALSLELGEFKKARFNELTESLVSFLIKAKYA